MKKKKQVYPYFMQEDYRSICCIYKLSFLDHFYIGGTKALWKRIGDHSIEIDRRLRLGLKPNDMYEKIVNFIKANNVDHFTVQVIMKLDAESEIPAAEQRIFDIVSDNPKCLNVGFKSQERKYHEQVRSRRERKLKEVAEAAAISEQLTEKITSPIASGAKSIDEFRKKWNV